MTRRIVINGFVVEGAKSESGIIEWSDYAGTFAKVLEIIADAIIDDSDCGRIEEDGIGVIEWRME